VANYELNEAEAKEIVTSLNVSRFFCLIEAKEKEGTDEGRGHLDRAEKIASIIKKLTNTKS